MRTLQTALRATEPTLARLGATTIRRVLHAIGYSYQHTRTWCPTGTAQRVRKDGVVTVYDIHTAEKIRQIEQAYHIGEAACLAVYCEDEAGPYQAIPQPGTHWTPQGHPARQPHEYVRGGTAKLLTLFRPATGEVRAKGGARTTNTILHPWIQEQMTAILAASSSPPLPAGQGELGALWEYWWGPT